MQDENLETKEVADGLGEEVLCWVERVTEGTICAVEPLNARGPWRLRIDDRDGKSRALVLRIPVPNWIGAGMIATAAAALQIAEDHGLSAPRLVASDLDGRRAGVAALLETALPGSSAPLPRITDKHLQRAGAAIAKIHAIPLDPSPPELPLRIRHTQVDDCAAERRWATLYQLCSGRERDEVVDAFCRFSGSSVEGAHETMSGARLTPLLHLADERIRTMRVPDHESVFLHGDLWWGNMLWEGSNCTVVIDWKTAGVGDPGVDLGDLRMQMAVWYGPDAAAQVLAGWQQERGTAASNVPYWDAVAALNTPAQLTDWPGFDGEGNPLSWQGLTERRDDFLESALDQLQN